MPCQACGRSLPTQSVTLYQNIGMIAVFRYKTLKGALCMPCLRHYFWEYTLVTLALGWWGLISFFLTPIMLINNFFFFLRALFMPPQQEMSAQSMSQAPTNAAFGSINNPCPKCQASQTTTVVPVGAVWAAVGLAALLFALAVSIAIPMLQHHTSRDWPVVYFFVVIDLIVGLCFFMLLRNPLQQCAQCKWEWPTHSR